LPLLELFADMVRQPKLRPEVPNPLFADGRSSQFQVDGTVAREDVHFADLPENNGRVTGTTNFVETIPVPVTQAMLERGEQRFTINCTPCHGAQADGKGITQRIGAMAVVANLHDKRIVEMKDGEIFNTITYGKGQMGSYGANVVVEDRWAIVAYLRSLQLARLGLETDVPDQYRSALKK
jgi:mono/diheme cytochrome c family protein